jgi:hypothetical protein
MKKRTRIFAILVAIMFTGISGVLYAHCDSYDGPVIKDALKALETNNVSLVLKWIDQKDETVDKGREYVAAYIDYTHTLEAIHEISENGALHHTNSE